MAKRHLVATVVGGLGLLFVIEACDPTPCEDDYNACTIDCVAGKAAHEAMPDESLCKVGARQGECAKGVCVVPCGKDGDCDDGDPCTLDKCTGGACTNAYGNMEYFGPDDPQDCLQPFCFAGKPTTRPEPDGTSCGTVGACDHGICDACSTDKDCGTDGPCQVFKCVKGTCVVFPKDAGTQVADPIKYDCKGYVCDGHGNVNVVALEQDVPPDDPTSCVQQLCASWTPVFEPKIAGTKCLDADGHPNFCDGKGACVACVKDTDCPIWGQYCYAGTCAGCDDKKKNGNETGIDCGGSCGACNGTACSQASQCKSGLCEDGVCCNFSCGVCLTCAAEGSLGLCVTIPKYYKDPAGCTADNKACDGKGFCKLANASPCTNNNDCASGNCLSPVAGAPTECRP
jgi:hypothetical protein